MVTPGLFVGGVMLTLPHLQRALGGEITGGQLVAPGPGHSPADRSMAVKIAPDHPGGFVVHSHAGDDPMACRDYVKTRAGIDDRSAPRIMSNPHAQQAAPVREDAEPRKQRAIAIWNESVDPRGTLVEDYLRSRGLELADEMAMAVIRFHPSCPFGKRTRHPCMVAAFHRIDTGELVAIHRTALTADGSKIDRKMMGPVGGAAMKLESIEGSSRTIVIGEGIETCLSARAAGISPVWATGSADAIKDFPVMPDIEAIGVLGEMDESGASQRATQAVGDRWHAAGREVHVFLPTAGKDINDALQANGSDAAVKLGVFHPTPEPDAPDAEPASADGPIPLFPPMPEAERFPIESLGPVLSSAAAAIARKVQVPEAIAAQSVLAVAALACQAHADVMMPYDQKRPLSLDFVTIAPSGGRKTSADSEALWPVRKREKALKEEHEHEHRLWSIAFAAWSAEKKKIEGNRKLQHDERRRALVALGPEPERPLSPFLTVPEPTIEGLVKAWVNAPAALGIFTAEGGMFIGGHGMSPDNRLRTAAGYSEMWDGQPIKRIRALDGVTILHGRRLSMHLMVQPDAAAQFLADPLLRDQGLLSRVLVAAPESIAGTRFYRDVEPEDNDAIHSYGARILSILEAPWPLAEGSRNELEPRVLTITEAATIAWKAFYNHIEGQCGAGGELHPVEDFAAKIAEHAARIAGVLTIVDHVRATEIGSDAMCAALKLADWYVYEALRLQRAARTDRRLIRAQQLLDWMRERGEEKFSVRDIGKLAPPAFRIKAAADEALAILASHGWIEEVSARPRRVRLVQEASA